MHDNCRRRAHFDAGEFLKDWNDPKQKNWCLFEKGCKGPQSYIDCTVRRWNTGINFCLDCGGVCQACGEPHSMTKLHRFTLPRTKRLKRYLLREKLSDFEKENS